MAIAQRLIERGIALPPTTPPAANYANAVRTGDLLFIAGKAPAAVDGRLPTGRLGREFTTAQGYAFARSAGLELLAVIRDALGSLDQVEKVVEVQGFLNTTEEFTEHPKVLDGLSDLLIEVFGERGVHVRSVLGAQSLRGGLPLVVKAVVEVQRSQQRVQR
ncbi:LysR family transcriptional regulator [Planctomycetota bacterium]|nr:LysR family transcriptional regulator [Planctomycetota bacterium]